jgi:hypothetical protein
MAIECQAFLDAECVGFRCDFQLDLGFGAGVIDQTSDAMWRAWQDDWVLGQIF